MPRSLCKSLDRVAADHMAAHESHGRILVGAFLPSKGKNRKYINKESYTAARGNKILCDSIAQAQG